MTRTNNIEKFVVTKTVKQCRRFVNVSPKANRDYKREANRRARRQLKTALAKGDFDFMPLPAGYLS